MDDLKIITTKLKYGLLDLENLVSQKELFKNKEFVLAAVSNNSFALKYADDSFKKDKEVVLAAVSNRGSVLLEAADSFLKKIEKLF